MRRRNSAPPLICCNLRKSACNLRNLRFSRVSAIQKNKISHPRYVNSYVDLTNRTVSLSFSDFDGFMEKITLRLPEKRIQSERLFIFPFL